MIKLTPANNVIFGFLGGALAYGALLWAKHIGYVVPADIADGLPYAISVALAHFYDMFTGGNKSPIQQVEQQIKKEIASGARPESNQ